MRMKCANDNCGNIFKGNKNQKYCCYGCKKNAYRSRRRKKDKKYRDSRNAYNREAWARLGYSERYRVRNK